MGFSLLDNIIQQEKVRHCTDLEKTEKTGHGVSFGKQIQTNTSNKPLCHSNWVLGTMPANTRIKVKLRRLKELLMISCLHYHLLQTI